MKKVGRDVKYQHPKRRKKKKPKGSKDSNFNKGKPRPVVTINRISRKLEPKVPDDIDMTQLSELYVLQGALRGLQMTMMVPQQLIDAVVRGEIPTHVDTKPLLERIKDGLESTHRTTLDHLEKRQTDLESVIGYTPVDEEALIETVKADQFIRIITIPENSGGGFCAELDPKHRGLGATKREALEKLAELLDADEQ